MAGRPKFFINRKAQRKQITELKVAPKRRAELAFEITGHEAVNQITELTPNTVPGIRAGDGPRQTHRGGWADRSTNLVRAISFVIIDNWNSRVQMELHIGVLDRQTFVEGVTFDDVIEYAEALEALSGYSVLGGVAKAAFKSLHKNIAKQ